MKSVKQLLTIAYKWTACQIHRFTQMQAVSHHKTGWTTDQITNKSFESNGKITTDKNKTRISFSLFLLHDCVGV